MALTVNGLVVQTKEELLDVIIELQQQNISPNIEIDDDTALGQLNQIVSTHITFLNELAQDVYDQRNIYLAEGKALDDCVSWMGVFRQPATATSGEQYFSGDDGITVIPNSFVKNSFNNETYTTDDAVLVSKSACRACTIEVLNVLDSTMYTITVEGTVFEFTSDSDATATEIIAGLQALITGANWGCVDNGDDTLTISVTDFTDLNITNDTNLRVKETTSAGTITGTRTGIIAAPVGTVDIIVTPAGGWISTYNPKGLSVGRAVESDIDFRNRAIEYRASTGTATVDAIVATLSNIEGVSSAVVAEQYVSQGTGSNGQPAGSINIIISGGTDDNEIAQAIWDTRPAGVEVWWLVDGSEATGTAVDFSGNPHTVGFNRPTAVPINNVSVTYEVYDSEAFPEVEDDANEAIKQAILLQGNALDAGQDVIADEFEGVIYGAVAGIYKVVTWPDTVIASTEQAVFSTSTMTVVKV